MNTDRQTDRQTDRSIRCNSWVFPLLVQLQKLHLHQSAPPRLRDTCDGSPSAERGEGEGGGGKERGRSERGRGRVKRGRREGVKEGEGRRESQSRLSVQTTECSNLLLLRL